MIIHWIANKIIEIKMKFSEPFGQYNRYQCWCLERNAVTSTEKMAIALEVLLSGSVSIAESHIIRNLLGILKMKG